MTTVAATLVRWIEQRQSLVGVVGLGYVGLPLARALTQRGFRVLGFDTDQAKVATLRRGETYIEHFATDSIRTMSRNGFEATTDPSRFGEPDVLLICVPTPLTPTCEPDLRYVRDAARAITPHLRSGQLVVLESTIYPGATRHVVLPMLQDSGLKIGSTVFLAYSPEREDPGRAAHTVADIPKVVGGLGAADLEVACTLYRSIAIEVVPVSSLEIAEASKLLENTYRAVNIALANEFKQTFDRMGIDVWQVIDAAATKPFGFQAFYPGPGLGGPCLSVNAQYLAWAARQVGTSAPLVETAINDNEGMAQRLVDRVVIELSRRGKSLANSRILLLGMAYKRNIGDCRGSPGIELMRRLRHEGADVQFSDPHVPRIRFDPNPDIEMKSCSLSPECLAQQDCLIVVTDHSQFDWAVILEHSQLVIDTRNATRPWLDRFRDRIEMA